MVIVKIIQNVTAGNSNGNDYLKNVIKYLKYDKEKIYFDENGGIHRRVRDDFVCLHGMGINYRDLDKCYEQMMTIKRVHHREHNNPLVHCVVSFHNMTDVDKCVKWSYDIEQYFGKKYQVIWALHKGIVIKNRKENVVYHTHFILNPISIKTGDMIVVNRSFICELVNHLNVLMDEYVEAYFSRTEHGQTFKIVGHNRHNVE